MPQGKVFIFIHLYHNRRRPEAAKVKAQCPRPSSPSFSDSSQHLVRNEGIFVSLTEKRKLKEIFEKPRSPLRDTDEQHIKVEPHRQPTGVTHRFFLGRGWTQIPDDNKTRWLANHVMVNVDLSGYVAETVMPPFEFKITLFESLRTPTGITSTPEVQENVLDPDLRIMDPHRYFENLNNLRRRVIRSSEFFRSEGEYKATGAIPAAYLAAKPSSVSANVWERCVALAGHNDPCSDIFGSRKDLAIFVKTYLMLGWIVDNLDFLNRAIFCGDYYSLLLEQPEHNVAEIIRVPRRTVGEFKESLEPVLLASSRESIAHSLKHAQDRCLTVHALFNSNAADRLGSNTDSSVQLFWLTAILLDLALVSYVGSHGLHFGHGINNVSRQFGAEVPGLFGFRCQLRRAACLDDFFDNNEIWTFQLFAKRPMKTKGQWAILSHIEELADLWGPVWAESAGNENNKLIKWYSVSKGYIHRVNGRYENFPNAIPCHWASEILSHQTPMLNSDSKFFHLRKEDLLLIGNDLTENENCTFSFDEFDKIYGEQISFLGTRPEIWRSDTRTLGYSLPKVTGFHIQVAQKLFPNMTLKATIYNRWTEDLAIANPSILNSLLGVEVSHCTGNARRVTLKSLIRKKTIQAHFDRWEPGWKQSQWGAAFNEALFSEDPNAIPQLWERHADYQCSIAEFIRGALDLLNPTGAWDGSTKLAAAFLHGPLKMSVVNLKSHGNEWAMCLCDSDTSAAYVLLDEICLEYPAPEQSISSCGGSEGYTVLQTQVNFQGQGDLSRSKLHLLPHNIVLARVGEEAKGKENTLMVVTSQIRRLFSLLRRAGITGYEDMDAVSQHDGTVSVRIQASTKKFGGMELARTRKFQVNKSSELSGSKAED